MSTDRDPHSNSRPEGDCQAFQGLAAIELSSGAAADRREIPRLFQCIGARRRLSFSVGRQNDDSPAS
jgi:hypothetical protein